MGLHEDREDSVKSLNWWWSQEDKQEVQVHEDETTNPMHSSGAANQTLC